MIGAPVSTNACMWTADATFVCPNAKKVQPANPTVKAPSTPSPVPSSVMTTMGGTFSPGA